MTPEEQRKRLADLEAETAALRRRLDTIGIVLRGSLVERWMPCGRRGCACQAKPPRLHGPYLQWTAKVKGKTRTVRLTKDQAEAYRHWIGNRRRLEEVIRDWERVGEAAADLIRGK
jgi:hypothetical protein